MILLDLALQGIRDLRGSMRVRLQSGYNALVSPGVKPDTILAGLLELLYHDPRGSEAAQLALPGAKAGGGLTLMDADGGTFRVMRDLSSGTAQLLELDRAARAFKPISTEPTEIAAFLRGRAGLPDRAAFEAVFVLRPADLPSSTAEVEAKGTEPDRGAQEARLVEVEQQLARHERVQALEYELDGLQKRRFDLEDALRALSFDPAEVREAEAACRRIAHLDALPADFATRVEEHQRLVARRDADLQRWEAERESIERAGRATEVAPVLRDWRLWVGLGAGSAAVVAASLLGGVLHYLALLDIPAFGLAAFVLYRSLDQREKRARVERRLALSDRRRETVLARDAAEIAAVQQLLEQAGLTTLQEVQAALETRDGVHRRLAELSESRRRSEEDPRRRAHLDEREQVLARIAEVEEELGDANSSPADVAALVAEADRLRAELGVGKTGSVEAAAAPAGPMGALFCKSAYDLLLTDPDSAARVLNERASLVIRAMSGNRLAGVLFDRSGAVQLRTAAGGAVAWDDVPAAAQNLAYLALRAALVLGLDQRARAPVLAVDLAGAMTGGKDASETLLATLAQAGQLVHLVRRPDQAPGAKHVATVGA